MRVNGVRGLLIVDEAQHLSLRALETLRALHDATGAGLALMGNAVVYARLTGGRRAAEFAQLFSRVGKRVRLTQVEEGDRRRSAGSLGPEAGQAGGFSEGGAGDRPQARRPAGPDQDAAPGGADRRRRGGRAAARGARLE